MLCHLSQSSRLLPSFSARRRSETHRETGLDAMLFNVAADLRAVRHRQGSPVREVEREPRLEDRGIPRNWHARYCEGISSSDKPMPGGDGPEIESMSPGGRPIQTCTDIPEIDHRFRAQSEGGDDAVAFIAGTPQPRVSAFAEAVGIEADVSQSGERLDARGSGLDPIASLGKQLQRGGIIGCVGRRGEARKGD